MSIVVTKQPGESRVLAFEFADVLASGETLSSVTSITPASEGLITGSVMPSFTAGSISGTQVRTMVTGGTDREAYRVVCLVVDSSGQTLEGDAVLFVLDAPADIGMVVEDGSGMPTAESYVSVTEADSYLRRRDKAATWDTYTPAQKAGLLISATEYVDANVSFSGAISNTEQALAWPRVNVVDKDGRLVDNDVIPKQLKAAVIEIAVLGQIQQESERTVVSESVGPISVTYDSLQDATQGSSRYRLAWTLLADITEGSMYSGPMVRS